MADFFFAMLWVGGVPVSYRTARRDGDALWSSIIASLTWPAEAGRALASLACGGPMALVVRERE